MGWGPWNNKLDVGGLVELRGMEPDAGSRIVQCDGLYSPPHRTISCTVLPSSYNDACNASTEESRIGIIKIGETWSCEQLRGKDARTIVSVSGAIRECACPTARLGALTCIPKPPPWSRTGNQDCVFARSCRLPPFKFPAGLFLTVAQSYEVLARSLPCNLENTFR